MSFLFFVAGFVQAHAGFLDSEFCILKAMPYFDDIRKSIAQIPRGKVATYGDVARAAGHPGTARQVAWALRDAGTLPWHRVLGSGGRILLPGESGMEQRTRLQLEGVVFKGGRVDMGRCGFAFRHRRKG